MKETYAIRNVDINIETTTEENLRTYIISTPARAEDIVIKIREYHYLFSPLHVVLPPIYRDSSGKDNFIVINNHIRVNALTGTGNNIESGQMYRISDTAVAENLLNSTPLTPYERIRASKILGCDVGEHFTYNNLIDMVAGEIEIPSKYDSKYWRYLRATPAIYLKMIRKLELITHGRMSGAMMQRIFTQEQQMLTEYVSNRIKAHDVLDKVVMPSIIEDPRHILNNRMLVLSDTPQSEKAGKVAHISTGTTLSKHGEPEKLGKYCVSRLLANNPFFRHIAPNRQVVSRYMTQAVDIARKDEPLLVSTEEHIKIPSVNVWTARMEYYGWTHEDSCVVSQSLADRLKSVDEHVDAFDVVNPIISVQPLRVDNQTLITTWSELVRSDEPYVNKGTLGVSKFTVMKSTLRSRGIVVAVRITSGHHLNEEIKHVEIISKVVRHLEIGEKLADCHGNKSIVARIMPNIEMPAFNLYNEEIQIDLIVPPYIGKRCCPSREMEELYSMKAHWADSRISIKPKDTSYSQIASEITNEMRVEDKNIEIFFRDNAMQTTGAQYHNVMVGKVRYFRLSQHANDKMRSSYTLNKNDIGIVERGRSCYNFGDAGFAMVEVGATKLLSEINDHVRDTQTLNVAKDYLACLGFDMEDGKIVRSRDALLVDKESALEDGVLVNRVISRAALADDPLSMLSENREGTVMDPRLVLSNGYVQVPAGILLVVSELARSIGIDSRNSSIAAEQAQSSITLAQHDALNIDDIVVISDGKKYIRLPKGLDTFITPAGSVAANELQHAVNSMIQQFIAYSNARSASTIIESVVSSIASRCNILFNTYLSQVYKKIFRKDGIIRKLAFPRVRHSFTAVFSGNPELDIDIAEIPIGIVKKMCRSEEFISMYQISSCMSISQINSIFEERNSKALISRAPVHQLNNALGMRIRAWRGRTIRVNPAIIGIVDGDFDGDTGIGYFPTTVQGTQDLDKMNVIQHKHLIEATKALSGANIERCETVEELSNEVRAIFAINSGKTETAEDIPTCYSEKKAKAFEKYMNGHDSFSDKGRAAREFQVMKQGAQMYGFLGNIARNILYAHHGPEGITTGSLLYHAGAQAALDSKNSMTEWEKYDRLFQMLTSLRDPGKGNLRDGLSNLFERDEVHINRVLETMYHDNRWNGGMSLMCARNTPTAHIIVSGNHTSLYRAAKDQNERSVVSEIISHNCRQ